MSHGQHSGRWIQQREGQLSRQPCKERTLQSSGREPGGLFRMQHMSRQPACRQSWPPPSLLSWPSPHLKQNLGTLKGRDGRLGCTACHAARNELLR